jgi:hypothetical protein
MAHDIKPNTANFLSRWFGRISQAPKALLGEGNIFGLNCANNAFDGKAYSRLEIATCIEEAQKLKPPRNEKDCLQLTLFGLSRTGGYKALHIFDACEEKNRILKFSQAVAGKYELPLTYLVEPCLVRIDGNS